MSLSHFSADSLNTEHTLNKCWHKRILNDTILVTTEHGGWNILNEKEYRLLRYNRIREDPNLFRLLEATGIIVTNNNFNRIVEAHRAHYAHLFTGTSLNIISPSLRCNHSCSYCFAKSQPEDSKGYDMSEETARAVIDFIMQSPNRYVTVEISGGEPLLNFDIVRYLFEYAKDVNSRFKKDLRFSIVTNLTSMDEDILAFLMENNVGISTSLDGPKEVHDKNRRYRDGSGSYSDVIYWIDKIRNEHNYGRLNALPVITRHSLSYSHEIVDEYVSHGLMMLRLKYMAEVGFASTLWKKIGYIPGEYFDFWAETLNYMLELNRRGVAINEGMASLMLKKIMYVQNPGFTDLEFPCGAGITQNAFSNSGDIYTCDEGRSFDIFKIGNVHEDDYRTVLTSKSVASVVDLSSGLSLLCDECVWKPFCGLCIVWSYSATKSVIPKLPHDFRCQAHSMMFEDLFRRLISSPDERNLLLEWASLNRY